MKVIMHTKEHSFNDIYNQHYRKCFLFAKSYLHDVDQASDCASDALIKLWESMTRGEEIRNLQAFLLQIVKNQCLNILQHEQVKLKVHDTLGCVAQRELDFRISTLESCDPDFLFSKDIIEIYEKTLLSLPEQTRRIFVMSRQEDLSNKEIADCMNISVKGVDYHIAKALKLLRVTMKDYLPLFLFFYYST